MGKVILLGNKDTGIYKNRSFRAVQFDLNIVAAAANTAFTATVAPLDLTEINVKIILNQFGVKTDVYSGSLYPAVMKSAYGTAGYFQFKSGSSTAQKFAITLAAASGVKETIVQKAVVDLGCFINLKGNDSLEVYVDFRSASATAQVGTTTTVEVDVVDGIGVQTKVPKIYSQQLTAGVDRVTESFPSNLTTLHFLNTDKDNILEASSPITTLRFSSDKLSYINEFYQLIGDRLENVDVTGFVGDLDHDHQFYSGSMGLSNVKLDMNTVASNVNVGENYLVATYYMTNKQILKRGLVRGQKHNRENLSKIK